MNVKITLKRQITIFSHLCYVMLTVFSLVGAQPQASSIMGPASGIQDLGASILDSGFWVLNTSSCK